MNLENAQVQKMLKAGFAFLVIVSVFFVVLIVNAVKESKFIGAGVSPVATITVSGEGEVFAVPDIAEVTFTVSERADDVATAQEAAAKIINPILEQLEDDFDIDEKDIKTVNYNAHPRYEYLREEIVCVTFPCPQPPGRQTLVGYEVSQSVRVKIRDTEEAGEVLSMLGTQKVDNVSGLNFTIDDEDELRREARQLAIENAEAKVEELADDLGVNIVRVVSFNEGGSFPVERFYAGDTAVEFAEEGAFVPEIPVGENQIISNVSITYEIR